MKRKSTKAIVQCMFSIVATTLIQISNAQIVYTNIKDLTYTCNNKCNNNCYEYNCSKTYALDLNKDGITDFNIVTSIQVEKYDGGNGDIPNCLCSKTFSNKAYLEAPYPNSIVLGPSGSALTTGSNISSSSEWSTSGLILKSVPQNCNLLYVFGGCLTLPGGDWPNSSDRYLGLRFILNGQTHYGWARLSVVVDNKKASFIIMDYAYESAPGASIVAGDIGTPAVTRSSNNNSNEEKTVAGELKITPNPISASGTISFLLAKPGKVSLAVYDMTGRLIKKIADKEYNEGIHYLTLETNEIRTGLYLLRMESEGVWQTRKFTVAK